MPKRWSKAPVLDGWVQIIKGPRPKSERWPSAKQNPVQPVQVGSFGRGRWRSSSRSSGTKVRSIEAALAVLAHEESVARAEPQAALKRAKEAPPAARVSFSPDTIMVEARLKVPKLEKALEALDGTSGAEVEAIKRALVIAKSADQEKPIVELVAECKSFIERSEKRLAKLEAERVAENAMLEEGRARLARLEAQAAVSLPLTPGAPGTTDLEAELYRLREELANARREIGASSGVSPQKKRLREDFVPATAEEAALWIRSRQSELEDGIARGCEADVSRLAQAIAEGAGQLSQWTQPPSSVVNMVS